MKARASRPIGLASCPDVLTIEQICRELQIGRSYYKSLVSHHRFPIKPLNLPGVIRYSKAALEAYLRGRKASAHV